MANGKYSFLDHPMASGPPAVTCRHPSDCLTPWSPSKRALQRKRASHRTLQDTVFEGNNRPRKVNRQTIDSHKFQLCCGVVDSSNYRRAAEDAWVKTQARFMKDPSVQALLWFQRLNGMYRPSKKSSLRMCMRRDFVVPAKSTSL